MRPIRKKISMREAESGSGRTRLFTLRLWKETLAPHRFEWRGRIEAVESGEVRYFRGDAALMSWLLANFSELDRVDPGER
jgi:hypothetical protein